MKSVYLTILSVCILISCKNNQKTVLNPVEILKISELNNLFFSKFEYKKGSKTEYSNQFTLNKDDFLTMHFTLNKPLIESLQELSPSLTVDELLENGNFQFSMLVDGKKVYTENLDKGAGLRNAKINDLSHSIRLVTPERIDFWGWYLWLKFMKIGDGRDALSLGDHVLEIEVRSYLNDKELKVGNLIASGSIDVNVVELPFDENLVQIQDIKSNSGWDVSKETFDHSKIEALNKKIAQGRFESINGIVVVKNNELLIEEYFNGATRESLHNPRSVGKTIASTMMGIAIEENYIESEDLTLMDFYNLQSYENYSDSKDKVTLKSLLTMSSGILGDDNDYDNPGNEEFMYPTSDWVKFTLDLPVQEDKKMGVDYTYFTAGAVVLGDVIHKSVPGGLVKYTDEKLFKPLGITNYKWQYTPQNVGNTAGGIQLRAVDFAKYGQLYKNKGIWNGEQILSPEWVEKSVSKQVVQPNHENGYYGYLFWNNFYTVNGVDYEVSLCNGNGGNKIYIFKDIPFVIVITASAYNMPYAHSNVDKMMVEYILPAILI
jgi:CubicO group peptidase (beta-lactamase class C family)